MVELNPCPFCGGKATTSHGVAVSTNRFFFVSCENCGCRTKNFFEWHYGEQFEKMAVKAWNKRAERGDT